MGGSGVKEILLAIIAVMLWGVLSQLYEIRKSLEPPFQIIIAKSE